MLDNHPQLAVANDCHFVPRALQKHSTALYDLACSGKPVPLTDALVDEVWNYHRFYRMDLDRSDLDASANGSATYQEFVAGLFELFAMRRGKSLAGEKTPDYVRHSRMLLTMFPASRLVHIVRDGRDTALSLLDWATSTKGPGRLQLWDEDPVAVTALWWKQFADCGPDSDGVADHANRWVTLKYEQLLEKPRETLKALCERLSLDYSDSMLRFHEGKAAERATAEHTGQSAKGRWLPVTRGLRDWKKSLPPQDVAVFESLAGETLELHGYELSGHSNSARADARVAAALEFWERDERLRRRPKGEEATSKRMMTQGALAAPSVFPVDDGLPYIREVMDPHAFEPILSENGILTELEACYVRYKPDTNCLVGYRQARTGLPWGFSVAHRADATDKLENARRFIQNASVLGRPTCGFVDSQRHVAVFRFPHDPRLPFLATRMTDLAAKGATFEVLSYKPQRRCVVKVTAADGSRSVVRFYREDEYTNARKAYRQLAVQSSGMLISHSDRHCTITTKWHEGDKFFSKPLPELDSQFERAGQWLGLFHQGINHKLPVVTPGDVLERLDLAVDALGQLMPCHRDRILRIAACIADALPLRVNRLVRSHGDFHAGQLILKRETDSVEMNAIDWDHACNAPAGCDAGSFVAHCLLEHFTSSDATGNAQFERQIDCFLNGYYGVDDNHTLPNRTQLDSYVVVAMLQVAIQPFRSCHPQWREQTTALVEYAERLLRREYKSSANDADLIATVQNPFDGEDLSWISEALNPQIAATELAIHGSRLAEIRPGRLVKNRRCLVEYKFEDGACILGKVRKKGIDLRAWHAQQQVYDAASRAGTKLQRLIIAESLGAIPDWNMWLQARLPGLPVNSRQLLSESPDVVHRIGQALGELHQLGVEVDRRHTIEDELEILGAGMDRVLLKRENWSGRIRTIQSACRSFLSKLSTDHETGIHRDFYPAQVILDSGRVGIVDLDLFATGHPAIDVGNFIAHLMEAAIRQSLKIRSVADHSEAFIAGYQSTASPLPRLDIEIMTFVSFARHIQISHRISDRRKSTRKLIRKCLQLMDQLASKIQP